MCLLPHMKRIKEHYRVVACVFGRFKSVALPAMLALRYIYLLQKELNHWFLVDLSRFDQPDTSWLVLYVSCHLQDRTLS